MTDDTNDTTPFDAATGSVLPLLAPTGGALAVLHEDLKRAAAYKKAAPAAATHRPYASDWRIYVAWCEARGLRPMPAHTEQIAALVANQAHAGARASTVERRVAAIGYYHCASNYPAQGTHLEAGGLSEAMAGIRRAPSGSPATCCAPAS